ncbi:MAG: stage V sporulation protein AB [Acetatifactor sp.]
MLGVIFMMVSGACYGLLSSAGVFTVLVAVGLVPRFAGKTHTAKKIMLFEEMVIFGTLVGCVLSVFSRYCMFGAWWQQHFPEYRNLILGIGEVLQAVFGLFAGMFIGCLALAIAEMLDSIPILTRRVSFRHGIGLAILSIAVGKLCGSLVYFVTEFHRTVQTFVWFPG